QALDRHMRVDDVVNPECLKVPNSVATLDRTRLTSELRGPLEVGHLTVRWGATADQRLFSLDVDRYIEETTIKCDQVVETLSEFADDLVSVFAGFAGPALWDWVEDADAE